MEDIAHDASGPASLKPGDVAPQQASRPDSPDRGKLRVFISYSRDDLGFADQLDVALNTCGFECIIDRHGISGGEDWKRRLGNVISESDTVVFVLSPTAGRREPARRQLGGISGEFSGIPVTRRRYPDNEQKNRDGSLRRKMARSQAERERRTRLQHRKGQKPSPNGGGSFFSARTRLGAKLSDFYLCRQRRRRSRA